MIFRDLDVLSEMSSPDTQTPLAPSSVENDAFRHFPLQQSDTYNGY